MSASTLRDRIIAEFALVNHTQTARKFYPAIGQDWKSPADPNAYHPQRAIAECLGNAIIPEIVDTEILNVKQRFDPTPNLPVSPTIGDTFLATATARGWTVDKLYTWNGTTYDEQTPTPGLPVWILATNTLSISRGIADHWLDISGGSIFTNIPHLPSAPAAIAGVTQPWILDDLVGNCDNDHIYLVFPTGGDRGKCLVLSDLVFVP